MSVSVELTVKYFSTASYSSVEYTVTEDFADFHTAEYEVTNMIDAAIEAAYEDDAMMDTFYYEFDYLVDAAEADEIKMHLVAN